LNYLAAFRNCFVGELLLSFITQGAGGSQAALNLRKVCSATKSWIDGLTAAQKRRFFPDLQVSIFLCRKNLADFLLMPPPFNVTSLKLQNPEFLGSLKTKPSPEEKKLIKSFANHWCPKLEFLEVDRLTEAVNNTFGSSAPSSKLKTIHCELMTEFFPKLLEIESLSVKSLVAFTDRNVFFSKLAANRNLKCFELTGPLVEPYVLEGLSVLLEANQNDKKQFKFTVNLNYLANGLTNLNLDLLKRFVYSVASSSSLSTIRLLIVSDLAVKKIVEVTEEQELVQKFLARVEWIELMNFNNVAFIVDLIKRNMFPNLQRFDEHFF